jgi:hypothetical protein
MAGPTTAPADRRMEDLLAGASHWRDVADRMGLSGKGVEDALRRRRPDLLDRWLRLRQDEMVPPRHRALDRMRDLAAEAAADASPRPGATQNANLALLLLAMFAITGSIRWPPGWVRAVQEEFAKAGCSVPTPAVARWMRGRLQDDPDAFASLPGADPELIEDLRRRLG